MIKFSVRYYLIFLPLILILGVTSGNVGAHYLWLEAVPADSPTRTNIDIRIGHDFPGRQLANNLRQFVLFDVYLADESAPVDGEQGRIPAGFVEHGEQPFTAFYRTIQSRIRMTAEAFLDYVKLEGLAPSIEEFPAPEPGSEITEKYTHHALLRDGIHQVDDSARLPTDGLLLRMIAASEGYFQLTYKEQPVVNAPVTLVCKTGPISFQRLYTDAEGRVGFAQLCEDDSFLRSIYLRPDGNSARQWQSDWVTLTLSR